MKDRVISGDKRTSKRRTFCVGNKGACPNACFQFVISARVDEYFVRMAGIMRGGKKKIFVLKHVIVAKITMERVELHDQIRIFETKGDDFFWGQNTSC